LRTVYVYMFSVGSRENCLINCSIDLYYLRSSHRFCMSSLSLPKLLPKGKTVPAVRQPTRELDSTGILRIDCHGCAQLPDVGSPMCVRCIVNAVAELGGADRIQLRTGKDTEISGVAAELLCDLASVNRVSLDGNGDRRCAICSRAPQRVMAAAWTDFPDPSFAAAREGLYTAPGDGLGCAACLQRTHSALVMAERNMDRVKKKAAELAVNRGGA
jgi:hypothetical protein